MQSAAPIAVPGVVSAGGGSFRHVSISSVSIALSLSSSHI